MSILNCFTSLTGRKKKDKGEKDDKTLQVRLQHLGKSIDTEESKSTFNVAIPFSVPKTSCNVKVISYENPVEAEVQVISYENPVEAEVQEQEEAVAYEGEDEHENENPSMKRNFSYSNSDLQSCIHKTPIQEHDQSENINLIVNHNKSLDIEIKNDGHLSDPGAQKVPFLASPKLKRSCSNLETRSVVLKKIIAPSKCESFEDLQKLGGDVGSSPVSVISHCSADKVILRKCSSSQILPSKSRRLWWKLFLWSHRNLHEPWMAKKGPPNKLAMINKQGGYSSDTLEPKRGREKSGSQSPVLFIGESSGTKKVENGDRRWDVFHGGSGLWPQNQWVAFSGGSPSSSPLTRVDEWVQEIPAEPVFTIDNDEEENEITFPPSPDNGKSLLAPNTNLNLPEEIAHANRVIRSLNSSSRVAHISGIGLKVIPMIAGFSSLRSVNLSGNSIVHITPGSLPKGLHTLNLSRNKINAIEGLRDLTRLRILDLSYNRISRIGQGLSKCTLIKELYLAGNKISNVEGLHRLLKLIILDLSFNKITTSKALGQLVANYSSLQALNLLGNPIQNNISDDQTRKALCGLLPKLAYLNKQPVNPQKAREVATEAVTKAVLGNGNLSARRRSTKRASHGGPTSSVSRHGNASVTQKSSRHGAKSRSQNRSTTKLSALAS